MRPAPQCRPHAESACDYICDYICLVESQPLRLLYLIAVIEPIYDNTPDYILTWSTAPSHFCEKQFPATFCNSKGANGTLQSHWQESMCPIARKFHTSLSLILVPQDLGCPVP